MPRVRLSMCFLAVALPSLALAHGPDVQWIMDEPRYKRANGFTHCCGPRDCRMLNDGEVMRVPGGYMVSATGQFIRDDWRALYRSINERYYGCTGYDGKTIECLFPPAAVGS